MTRDPFFREFFREFDRSNQETQLLFAPRMNVVEHPEAFEVVLEVPGLTKDDINIEVDQGRLAIWGEKKTEKEDQGKKVHVREITYGSFRRELTLPDDVVQDRIQANYDNGHLKLTLPRQDKKASTRKIGVA
jgi:HSP20 family protein